MIYLPVFRILIFHCYVELQKAGWHFSPQMRSQPAPKQPALQAWDVTAESGRICRKKLLYWSDRLKIKYGKIPWSSSFPPIFPVTHHDLWSPCNVRKRILAALSGPAGPWMVRGYFCLNRSSRPCRWGNPRTQWSFCEKTWDLGDTVRLHGFGMSWINFQCVSRWMWSPNLTCGVVHCGSFFWGELSPAGGWVVILPLSTKGSWLEPCCARTSLLKTCWPGPWFGPVRTGSQVWKLGSARLSSACWLIFLDMVLVGGDKKQRVVLTWLKMTRILA